MTHSYVVVADHITRAGVSHRSFYGPLSWSHAAAYADYLADSYAGDGAFRIDGQPAVTTIIIETMTLPPATAFKSAEKVDTAVHDGLGVGGRTE